MDRRHYPATARRRRRTMANTDISQRSQYERTDLLAGGEGIRRGSQKGAAIYTVIALLLGVALCVTALATIESWAQWIVLGVIVLFTVAVMAAIGPNRKGSGSAFKVGR
jgi:VIT1/CCC1 family predicted Fe2+/Mn2+ transporter